MKKLRWYAHMFATKNVRAITVGWDQSLLSPTVTKYQLPGKGQKKVNILYFQVPSQILVISDRWTSVLETSVYLVILTGIFPLTYSVSLQTFLNFQHQRHIKAEFCSLTAHSKYHCHRQVLTEQQRRQDKIIAILKSSKSLQSSFITVQAVPWQSNALHTPPTFWTAKIGF